MVSDIAYCYSRTERERTLQLGGPLKCENNDQKKFKWKKDEMKCTRILLNRGDERVHKAKDRFINTKCLTYFIPINIFHS